MTDSLGVLLWFMMKVGGLLPSPTQKGMKQVPEYASELALLRLCLEYRPLDKSKLRANLVLNIPILIKSAIFELNVVEITEFAFNYFNRSCLQMTRQKCKKNYISPQTNSL